MMKLKKMVLAGILAIGIFFIMIPVPGSFP